MQVLKKSNWESVYLEAAITSASFKYSQSNIRKNNLVSFLFTSPPTKTRLFKKVTFVSYFSLFNLSHRIIYQNTYIYTHYVEHMLVEFLQLY